MAELVNRTAAGRIECLDYLLLNLRERFPERAAFTLNDAKFSDDRPNVHDHCKLLKVETNLNISYCPYFTNPLSQSGCALTNSLMEDSQKQKAVSNTVNALHGLGLLDRGMNTTSVTEFGERFSSLNYLSDEIGPLISDAVGEYGPLVGMLGQIQVKGFKTFATSDIAVGYPNSGDEIHVDGQILKISVGSQADSNVRSRSVLLAWAVAGGFIEPVNWDSKSLGSAHLEFRDYLLKDKRADKFYTVTSKIADFFAVPRTIERPLDYEHLTKDVNALREKGQGQIRSETKKVIAQIRNRRFAIIYLLNEAYKSNTNLEFSEFLVFLRQYSNHFVISDKDFRKIMTQELSIAFAAGIPFILTGTSLKPMNGVNERELSKGAPSDLLEILSNYND